MVASAELLFLLEFVADYMWERRPHAQLVTLLQTCSHFGAWRTRLRVHLDNTIRPLIGQSGAWPAGNSQVMFLLRVGSRARFMARRGHRQPVDLPLMNALGYVPDVVCAVMAVPRTVVRFARTTRFYPTGQGHVEVQEMEASVKFLGRHYAYWCVQVVTYYQADPPSDTSDAWPESDLSSLESDDSFV